MAADVKTANAIVSAAVDQSIAECLLWVETWLGRLTNSVRNMIKFAVVMDLDDTALFTFPNGASSIVPAVYVLYQRLLQLGMRVYFVTAREDTPLNRLFTIQQLQHLGYTTYDALFLRPKDDPSHTDADVTFETIAAYKARTRQSIATDLKTVILLNVGNSWGDLFSANVAEHYVDTYDDELPYFVDTHGADIAIRVLKMPTFANAYCVSDELTQVPPMDHNVLSDGTIIELPTDVQFV
jgi:hypothetical protein